MSCQINNQSDMDDSDLNPLAKDLMGYMQKKIGFNKPPSALTYQDDSENAGKILGKTAYYSPNDSSITIFVTKRHPKDILRSLAHELVHHKQNEDGEFEDIGEVGEGYAQSNDKLRGMERQAYEMGNMCFRDWEDGYKNAILESIYKQQQILRRNKTMKVHKWKNNELNRLLMERFMPKQTKQSLYESKVKKHLDKLTNLGFDEESVMAMKGDSQDVINSILSASGIEKKMSRINTIEELESLINLLIQSSGAAPTVVKAVLKNALANMSDAIDDAMVEPPAPPSSEEAQGEYSAEQGIEDERPIQAESKRKRNIKFRKKVRKLLESINFAQGTLRQNKKRVTVRKRRK